MSQAHVLDYGATASGAPMLTLLCTLIQTNASSSDLPTQYPAYGPSDDGTSARNAMPAILTMSVDLTDTNDPVLIDVDILNAHNN